jgi:hypothetical protein
MGEALAEGAGAGEGEDASLGVVDGVAIGKVVGVVCRCIAVLIVAVPIGSVG